MAGCDRIGHCMAKQVSRVVQRDGLRSVMLPGLVLQRFVQLADPETADRRMRIPVGRPDVMTASAVPRPFRSGRWSPCAFSARADTVRIRVRTPMMIVKAARSLRCAFIGGFLFTWVNRNHWVSGYFNAAIPSKIAVIARELTVTGNRQNRPVLSRPLEIFEPPGCRRILMCSSLPRGSSTFPMLKNPGSSSASDLTTHADVEEFLMDFSSSRC